MRFVNFRIHDEPGVVLQTIREPAVEGRSSLAVAENLWDLHNFADFDRVVYAPKRALLSMRWSVSASVPDPWGDKGNHHAACELMVREVTHLSVSPRDPEMPRVEDLTLEWCGMAERGMSSANTWEFPHSPESAVLRFAFHGGMTVEVQGSTAVLIGIRREELAPC